MEFGRESEMLDPVRRWMQSRGMKTKAEFTTPWGICDVVGVQLHKARVSDRLQLNQYKSLTSPLTIAVLDAIPDEKDKHAITYRRLQRVFDSWMQPSRLSSEIERLMAANFVTSPRRNQFLKRNGWMPLQKRIEAIELKLNRVEEALSQAYNNLKFASHSYVALPEKVAHRVQSSKRKHAFTERGVGLISVSPSDCNIIIRSKPPQDTADQVLQKAYVERFWRMIVRGNLA